MTKKIYPLSQKSYFDFSSFINNKKMALITNVRFYYIGFHNITFKAKYDNIDVQIRVPNSNLVDWNAEKQIYKNFEDCLYYKNGFLIKKWFDGVGLDKIKITNSIKQKVIDAVKDFHSKNFKLKKFDWLYYDTVDLVFLKLVKKYKNIPLVVGHCDLAAKNIITSNGTIKFIDYEWVRLAPRHFDAITIMRNFNINRKKIMQEFNISDTELADFEYMFDTFNKDADNKVYNLQKSLNDRLLGKTNVNYKVGNFFLKYKIKNRFNHEFPIYSFPKNNYFLPVIYEDEKILINKFIENKPYTFNETNLRNIAHALKNIHELKLDLPKNTIGKQLKHFIDKSFVNVKEMFNTEFIELMLAFSKKLNGSFSVHNDLIDENIIVNGEDIKFIDLEYASKGDNYYDLAYFMEANQLNKQQRAFFLNAYFIGEYDRNKLEKFCLFVNFFGLLWSLNNDNNTDFINYNIKRIKELRKTIF